MLDPVRPVPTMLGEDEQLFYHWLTHDWSRDAGATVDLGCFAGGSTARLAEGHRKAGHSAMIHAYDRFGASAPVKESILYAQGVAPFEGEDILPLATALLEPWTEQIELHPGLIEDQIWDEGPIEILVMDASKNTRSMDRMAEIFFPSLIPGGSVVVQQDYLHWKTPWIAVQMARMAEHFVPVTVADPDTVAFLCVKAVDQTALAAGRCSGLSDADMRDGLGQARAAMRPFAAAPGVKKLIRATKANPGARATYQMR